MSSSQKPGRNAARERHKTFDRILTWCGEKTGRFVRWLLFVVVVAIASFAIASLWQWLKGKPVDFTELIAGGEGFLVTIAITADAVGRAAESKNLHSVRALACAVVLVVALIGFVFTASGKQDQRDKIESDIQNIKMDDASTGSVPGIAADVEMAAHLMRDEKIIAKYKRLVAAEEEQPYDPKRIAKMSLYLAACGLVGSFLVILLEEEHDG